MTVGRPLILIICSCTQTQEVFSRLLASLSTSFFTITAQQVTSPVLLLDVGEDLHVLSSDLFAVPQ